MLSNSRQDSAREELSVAASHELDKTTSAVGLFILATSRATVSLSHIQTWQLGCARSNHLVMMPDPQAKSKFLLPACGRSRHLIIASVMTSTTPPANKPGATFHLNDTAVILGISSAVSLRAPESSRTRLRHMCSSDDCCGTGKL